MCLRRAGGEHGSDGTASDFDDGDGCGGRDGVWDGLGVFARGVSVDAAGNGPPAAEVGAGNSCRGQSVWTELNLTDEHRQVLRTDLAVT